MWTLSSSSGSDIDGGVSDEQGAGVGRRVHDEDVGDAACGAQAGVAVHGGLHQLVGVQAALHHGLGVARAADGDADLGGLLFASGLEDRIRGNIDADLGGKRLHGCAGADESGLNQASRGGFHSAAQGDIGKRPNHRGGDRRQTLAALDELMKDVVVGRMSHQRIKGNGFGERS